MYIHIERDNGVDPRILRTRELLINSFAKLLVQNKSIRKVSVQSVTKQAGVNRVTFYAHFTDKYDLLDTWARLMFKQSVVDKLPENTLLDQENLSLLVGSTLDFFTYRSQYQRRINDQFEPMFEAAIQEELKGVLEKMLGNTRTIKKFVSKENLATFLSWAIFGSLLDWTRNQKGQSKETLTSEIIALCLSVNSLGLASKLLL